MKPDLAIGIIVLISIFYHSVMGYSGYDPGIEGESLMGWSLVLMYAWWVLDDAKKNSFHRPFEFGAFIIFAWPIVLPVYLVATRGWKGMLIFPFFVLLNYLPRLSGWLAYFSNSANQ